MRAITKEKGRRGESRRERREQADLQGKYMVVIINGYNAGRADVTGIVKLWDRQIIPPGHRDFD